METKTIFVFNESGERFRVDADIDENLLIKKNWKRSQDEFKKTRTYTKKENVINAE